MQVTRPDPENEYSYYDQREKRERRDLTLTPSAYYESFVSTGRIGEGRDQFSLVYGNFQLTGSNSISAEVTTQVEENSILSIGGNCGELPLQGHDFELG